MVFVTQFYSTRIEKSELSVILNQKEKKYVGDGAMLRLILTFPCVSY